MESTSIPCSRTTDRFSRLRRQVRGGQVGRRGRRGRYAQLRPRTDLEVSMKRIAILTTILLALPGLAFGAGFAKVGTFGGQELKIGVSARATGMGSAFTGVADDASSVFWNRGRPGQRGQQRGLHQPRGVGGGHQAEHRDPGLQPAFDPGHLRGFGPVLLDGPAAGAHRVQPRGDRRDLRLGHDDVRPELRPVLHRQVLGGHHPELPAHGAGRGRREHGRHGLRHHVPDRHQGPEAGHDHPEPGRQVHVRRARVQAAGDLQGGHQLQRHAQRAPAADAAPSSSSTRRTTSSAPTPASSGR